MAPSVDEHKSAESIYIDSPTLYRAHLSRNAVDIRPSLQLSEKVEPITTAVSAEVDGSTTLHDSGLLILTRFVVHDRWLILASLKEHILVQILIWVLERYPSSVGVELEQSTILCWVRI
jgi:hypothetical protein